MTKETPIVDVINRLFPFAENGLKSMGVDRSDIDTYLGIIAERLQTGITGARWQKNTHRHFEKKYNREKASRIVSGLYVENSRNAIPVAKWSQEWS